MGRDISTFQAELDRQASRSQSKRTSGSDYQWFTTQKPAKIGETVRQKLRILPRPNGEGIADEFWRAVDQHILTVDGQTKVFVCPDDHDNPDSPKMCPLCTLSRDLYGSGNPVMIDTAKDLSTRRRVFVNAVDLEQPDAHFDGDPHVFVWAFSQSVLNGLLDICVAKRAFIDDPQDGRDVLLSTNRIGPHKRDVRYSVTDMDPSPLDAKFGDLLSVCHDLADLSKAADMDDLHEVAAIMDPRPGNKRTGGAPMTATVPVSGAPAPPAPKPPAPPTTQTTEFHYSGPAGAQEGLTASRIAEIANADPDGAHHVWVDGWDGWKPTTEVPAIMEAMRPPTNRPPSPPMPPGGAAF